MLEGGKGVVHRFVMHVRANHSEVFASYTLERWDMFLLALLWFVPPREYEIVIFGFGGDGSRLFLAVYGGGCGVSRRWMFVGEGVETSRCDDGRANHSEVLGVAPSNVGQVLGSAAAVCTSW